MPKVLHVLPPDAPIACFGLEAWLDAGRGFLPLVAMAAPGPGRWEGLPLLALPAPVRGLDRIRARLQPASCPWSAWLLRHEVALIHLHDLGPAPELLRAANRLDLPVVASWTAGSPARFPFEQLDHVLAPSPAIAEAVRRQARGRVPVRVAPPPLLAGAPGREVRATRWVTAVAHGDRRTLALVARAFALFQADEVDELLVLVDGAWLGEAGAIARNLAPMARVQAVHGGDELRQALASARLALFPKVGWPTWLAASLGLPMVLGRAAAEAEGLRDHQQALLCEPEAGALATRMRFMANRPYIWPVLGEAARHEALGRLAYERACEIPFEVYRHVLREHVAAIGFSDRTYPASAALPR